MSLCALCQGAMNTVYPDDVQCVHGDRASRATLWLAIVDPLSGNDLVHTNGYKPMPLVMVDDGDAFYSNRDYIAFPRAEKAWVPLPGVTRLVIVAPDPGFKDGWARVYGWTLGPPEPIPEGYVYSIKPRELPVMKGYAFLDDFMRKACVE